MADNRFDMRLAAAYVRTVAGEAVSASLREKNLDELTESEMEMLFGIGQEKGLKMYRFKRHEELPRVKKVLGFLKGVQPESLLDVGSGRGVFLFPFIREFPWVNVTSLDLLDYRVDMLNALHEGGIENLTAYRQDICTWDMPNDSFDVVTLLEVLEHIPDVALAIRAAVRLAKRYVVVTVPSKPDDNPEHIHLLTKEKLEQLFYDAGCKKLSFDGVNGHLFMTAAV